MEKQILSDKEIESILQFNRSKKNGIRFVDLYHALNEEYGLYEAEKSVLSILDKSIVLTEHEKKRALLEGRACMTSVDANILCFMNIFVMVVKILIVLRVNVSVYQR